MIRKLTQIDRASGLSRAPGRSQDSVLQTMAPGFLVVATGQACPQALPGAWRGEEGGLLAVFASC